MGITGSLHCSIVVCEKLTLFNPLTTNDNYSRHRNSAASLYKLAQSVECSVMIGCGQGHEPAKNFQRKLCVVSSAGFRQILR